MSLSLQQVSLLIVQGWLCGLLMRRRILSVTTAQSPVVKTPINLVQGLIRLGPIKDPIWPLLSMHF